MEQKIFFEREDGVGVECFIYSESDINGARYILASDVPYDSEEGSIFFIKIIETGEVQEVVDEQELRMIAPFFQDVLSSTEVYNG